MSDDPRRPRVAWRDEPLLFERGGEGRIGVELPASGVDEVPLEDLVPVELLGEPSGELRRT